jgi:alpha-1,4-digalacturonate transport system permease protein
MSSIPEPIAPPATPPPKRQSVRQAIGEAIGNGLNLIYKPIMNGLDYIFGNIQKVIGIQKMGYVFLLPNLLIFSIFVLFPMLLNIYYSTTGGTAIFPADREFVGTENYETLFNCENIFDPNSCQEDKFWRGVYNTLGFVSVQVTGMILFSLITALALNQPIAARGFFRSVFFYPVLLSPVVVALIWKWILQREGILNAAVVAFGGDNLPFLLNVTWARFWVIFVSIWAQMGFYTLILLAGLQSIPGGLYEAAQIDGANKFNLFRFITMPLLMPTMLVVVVLALIRAVQVFDQVFVLTGGGPGTATQYLVQYIYDTGFSNQIQRFGLAAAASVVLGGSLLVLTLIQLYLGRDSQEE